MNISSDGLRVENCYKCDISTRRKCIVNGFGTVEEGGLVFIGEAPGAKEDRYGLPLIGSAGEVFNDYLYEVGLDRDHVYTTNTIKCRPDGNRNPFPHELLNCLPILRSELKVIKPKIVVLLGSVATKQYYQNDSLKVSEIRSVPYYVKERVVLSIYHPAYLRYNSTDSIKSEYWDNFVMIARLYKELVDPTFTLKY